MIDPNEYGFWLGRRRLGSIAEAGESVLLVQHVEGRDSGRRRRRLSTFNEINIEYLVDGEDI